MWLTRRMEFSASHRPAPDSPGIAHGHNYNLAVTLQGPVDESTGMVVDLKRLKEVMDEEIGSRFDHRNLNEDTPYFRDGRRPTGENFAVLIFELLDRALPDRLLHAVRLSPHADHWIEIRR